MASPLAGLTTRRRCGRGQGDTAIVTAYNDMLSAHQPYARFPDLIKEAARAVGGSAQVAGGVPAMCDGVTQGEKGMELSLFSRDVIALSTAVALSRRHVRRRGLSRHLRQDCAGPHDRRAVFSHCRRFSCPRDPCLQALATPRSRRSVSSTPRVRPPAPICWRRKPRPITPPVPAPFTARPTPTRC